MPRPVEIVILGKEKKQDGGKKEYAHVYIPRYLTTVESVSVQSCIYSILGTYI